MSDASSLIDLPTFSAKVKEQLNTFESETPSLRYVTLASTDGFVVADSHQNTPVTVVPERMAAMAASLSGISRGLAAETAHTSIEGSLIETKEGFIVCRMINNQHVDAVLLGVFDSSSNHGVALWMLKRISDRISELIDFYN